MAGLTPAFLAARVGGTEQVGAAGGPPAGEGAVRERYRLLRSARHCRSPAVEADEMMRLWEVWPPRGVGHCGGMPVTVIVVRSGDAIYRC